VVIREWAARVVAMFRKRSMRDRLDRELALHRALLAEDLAAQGSHSTPGREMGSASFRDAHDDQAGVPWLEHLWSDLRYALRSMRRSPGFSFVVILTLALGIGVNTAIFSVVHAVLLEPLPYPASERLVWLGEATGRAEGISVTWPNFTHWRSDNRSFETMAAFQYGQLTLTGRGDAQSIRGLSVTSHYVGLLGMQPLLGRLFTDQDDRPGAAETIVLNHRFWSGVLGGDPHIVGTTLILDGRPYEVIGVAAPLWETRPVDYYLSLGRLTGGATNRSQHGSIRALARLKPGVTVSAARADLDSIMRHLAEADPGPENEHRSYGEILSEHTTGGARATLIALMAAAGLVLLVACANVASLLLARSTTRATEFAVRSAIGAGRGRLVRQLLTENIVLSAAGGALGVLLALWTGHLLLSMAPQGIPRLSETSIDVPVLIFAGVLSLATGLLFGMAPILTGSRVDLSGALKAGARTVGGDAPRQLARSVFVVGEVALTFVLVFGAGLLLRSLISAQQANPGVDARDILSVELRLPGSSYNGADAIGLFHTALSSELRAIPGVTGISRVRCPPGNGDCADWFYSIPGRPQPARNEVPIALTNVTEPGYFGTMRIALRQGRDFSETDRPNGPKVAIVNETFARTWWPSEPAVAHQIKMGGPYMEGPLLEVVGVVADVKQNGLDSQPMPEIYQPFAQQSAGASAVMIRTAGDPEALIPAVRRAVARVDRNLPIQRLAGLERTLGASLARRRFSTFLLTGFAGLAVLLAMVGIYGLLSYWVSVREHEIGIRLALGARPGVIVRWTSLQAIRLAAIGMAFGALGAWAAARGLEDLVFGIPARSPLALAVSALAVVSIATVAAAIPAWRASRVDVASQLHQS
jgi:putative ABC transport system permease protein